MRIALWGLLAVIAACGDNLKSNVPMDAAPDVPVDTCGDGVVEGVEQCDDGDANGTSGARCTTGCVWVCVTDVVCTDMDPCNGTETCVDHACVAGTALNDGESCGTGKLCRNGACGDASCGDGFVTAPEECDDANATAGDGCENDCTFSCLSTDSTRNCTPADACAGQGTCNDSTHTCTPGSALPDNTSCGTGGYCKAGTCTQPMCGNGMTEPGEDCDLGTANGTMGSGCKADCSFECVNPATDCPAAPACNMASCSATHTCQNVADASQNGNSCGTNLECNNGACVTPSAVCGNGTTETGEQCDFGTGNNGPGTGCESNCQFSCTVLPDSCTDGNPCNGTETCTMVTVNAKPGQKCTATAPPTQGASCGTGKICLGQVCVSSMCGDQFVDSMAGEECEPPNTATCSATCQDIMCGDSVRAGNEQCDDGNLTNLDGCDSSCKFEQCQRVNSLAIGLPPNDATSTFCTKNALGSAIVGGTAQGEIGDALTTGVADGSITIALKALDLDDLTGTMESGLTMGVLTGTHVNGTGYNGNSDLDWWYTTAASVIDAMRNPTTSLAASITAKTLNGGPSDITISISLAGMPATLNMLRAKLRGDIGNANVPLTSTGNPPGHLASEHLNPALTSFATVTNGQLCGDVTAGSLDAVAIPSALVGCGFLKCTACYTSSNTLLDVIVTGCTVNFVGKQIDATQPDSARNLGDAYVFTVDSSTKRVNGCTKNGAPAQLSDCLDDAAYSSFFRFTTDRVIMK